MKYFLTFLLMASLFIGGFYSGLLLSFSPETPMLIQEEKSMLNLNNIERKNINIPAVDQNGRGVITELNVNVKPGSGKTLVDINNIIFWGDTQESIQTARDVASDIINADTSNVDITYSIDSSATIIEGQSAGAALTISTIAALRGEELPENVMITGTIDKNGRIGPIGGVVEKAKASKQIGADIFLVPDGQSEIRQSKPVTVCKNIATFNWCTVKHTENITKVEDVVDIQIVEVSNIYEALEYFDIEAK